MVEEINLAEDRKKKLRKILKTDPEKRSDGDIKLIEALVEVTSIHNNNAYRTINSSNSSKEQLNLKNCASICGSSISV